MVKIKKKRALVHRQVNKHHSLHSNNADTSSYERLVDVCLFADVEPILQVFYDVFVYSFVVLVSAPSEACVLGRGGLLGTCKSQTSCL